MAVALDRGMRAAVVLLAAVPMTGCFVPPGFIDCEVEDHPACAEVNDTDASGTANETFSGSTTTAGPSTSGTVGSTSEAETDDDTSTGSDGSSSGDPSDSETELGSESGTDTGTGTGSDTDAPLELGPCAVPFAALNPNLEGDGASGHVVHDNFTVRFDPARGGTLSSLQAGGPNLMAGYDASLAEILSGVLAYNAGTDTVDAATSWLTGDLSVIESGPVLTRVLVDYGNSIFTHYTVHPDGRIVRDQQWHQTTELGASYLLTFLALAHDQIDRVRWTGTAPHDTAVPNAGGAHDVLRNEAIWQPGFSCGYRTRDDLGYVGVVTYPTVTGDWPEPPADRVTIPMNTGAQNRLALQADWVDSDIVYQGIYNAQSMIVVGQDDDAQQERCACVEALQQAYTGSQAATPMGPPSLVLTGAVAVTDSMPTDYDGDGFDEGMGVHGVDPIDRAEAIDIIIPGSSASTLSLKVHHTTSVAGVELDGVPLDQGILWEQQLASSGNEVFLYVGTGIPEGATLRVVL